MTSLLDTKMVTAQPLQISGANFENYEILKCKDVLWPKDNLDQVNNPNRIEIDWHFISSGLQPSIKKGIDYNKLPPIVNRCNKWYKGKLYYYEGIAGYHRDIVFNNLGTEEWIYAVYSKMDAPTKYKLNLAENDHAPELPSTVRGIANTLIALHETGTLENTRKDFTEILAELIPRTSPTKRDKAIDMALKDTGGVIDYKTYNPFEIKQFLKNDKNGYKFGGGLVQNPEGEYVHSFTLGEGKEERMVWNSLKRLASDNHESEFIAHTNAPKEDQTPTDKRKSVSDQLDKLHEVLEHAYNYRKETGRWPYKLKAFLPQDNKAKEKELIFVA